MADKPNRPLDEQLIATAAAILFDDGNLDLVNLLLACDLETEWYDPTDWADDSLDVHLIGPYLTVRELRKELDQLCDGPLSSSLKDALNMVLPTSVYVRRLLVRVKPVEVRDDWRTELMDAIRGGTVHNQAVGPQTTNIHVWEGLRFRSKAEMKIAQALDRAGVLFLPNCKARLGLGKRENREPDFLICSNGKWGILEVDGEPYHPASRAVHDHARDRGFKLHGIVFIDHYDAAECYNNPDAVVKEFLKHLASS